MINHEHLCTIDSHNGAAHSDGMSEQDAEKRAETIGGLSLTEYRLNSLATSTTCAIFR